MMLTTLDLIKMDKQNFADVLHSAYYGSSISSDLNKLSRVRTSIRKWESLSQSSRKKIMNDIIILSNVFHKNTIIRFMLFDLDQSNWSKITTLFKYTVGIPTQLMVNNEFIELDKYVDTSLLKNWD